MALIDSVNQMRDSGSADADIAQKMREKGYSPQDVDDAIAQSKIKAAINDDSVQDSVMQNFAPVGMQASISDSQVSEEGQQSEQQQPQQDAAGEVEQYNSQIQGYAPQETYRMPNENNIEMINEVAEQIVTEKLSSLRKSIGNIAEFKSVVDAKISGMDQRLEKIENIIDQLQMSLIGKIGNYGQTIQDIKSEMEMMQDSFSKVLNPLVDRGRVRQDNSIQPSQPKVSESAASEQAETSDSEQSRKQRKPNFEDYLRG